MRVKANTKFEKICAAVCNQLQIRDKATVRFVFDGREVKQADTPESLEMEQDDQIDILEEYAGGSCI